MFEKLILNTVSQSRESSCTLDIVVTPPTVSTTLTTTLLTQHTFLAFSVRSRQWWSLQTSYWRQQRLVDQCPVVTSVVVTVNTAAELSSLFTYDTHSSHMENRATEPVPPAAPSTDCCVQCTMSKGDTSWGLRRVWSWVIMGVRGGWGSHYSACLVSQWHESDLIIFHEHCVAVAWCQEPLLTNKIFPILDMNCAMFPEWCN